MQQPEDPIIGAVDRLSARLGAQTTAIEELHDSVVKETSARERKVEQLRKLTVAGVTMLVLIIIGVAGVGILINQNNNAAEERARAAAEQRTQQQATADLLKDCVTPGGACFQENEKRTASALQLLQRYEYVVGYCSASFPNQSNDYEKCVLSFKIPGAPTDFPGPSK